MSKPTSKDRSRLLKTFMKIASVTLLVITVSSLTAPNTGFAEGREFSLRGHDLQIHVDSRWAGNTHGGYYPIRIRLTNNGPPRNLTFLFSSDYDKTPEVRRTIGAEQNSTVRFTLSIPMVSSGSSGTLRIYSDGEFLKQLSNESISLASLDTDSQLHPSLLVISPEHVNCDEFEKAVNSFGGTHSGYRSVTEDHEVVTPNMLPDSWIDYSGLDIVAIPQETLEQIELEQRNAILKWVQTGGTLVVYTVSDQERLNRVLEFEKHGFASEAWAPTKMKRRFINVVETDRYGNVQATAEKKGANNNRNRENEFRWSGYPNTFLRRDLMLGTVYSFQDNPFPGSPHDWAWFLSSMGDSKYSWTKRQGFSARGPNSEFLNFLIPGLKTVPVYSFLVFITLFTVVIGPVNYWYLRKRKQLYMLVISIPVIAFLTSVTLFAYSAVAHGFGIDSRVRSMTFLDQRSKTAVTTSRVALFAGLAPSEGLRFSPDTAVYTLWRNVDEFESGRVDWTETQALEGGWLRSRTRTQFVTTTHRDERGRMEFEEPADGKMGVSNGLEWDIEAMIAADSTGKLYYGRDLPAGASTRLTEATLQNLQKMTSTLGRSPLQRPDDAKDDNNSEFFWGSRSYYYRQNFENTQFAHSHMETAISRLKTIANNSKALPENSYLVIFSQNPDVEIGLDTTTERDGLHLLMGYF